MVCVGGVAITVGIVIVVGSLSRLNPLMEEKELPGTDMNSHEPTELEQLQNQLIEWNISTDRTALLDRTSAQYQAMDWLAYHDPAQLNLHETERSILLDRYVLAVFYFSTNGPNWTFQGRHLTNTPICEWGGIACNGLGSIVAVLIGTSLDSVPPNNC